MVDLTPDEHGRPRARLLDLVPGRSGRAYGDWLEARGDTFRAEVKVATLDLKGPRTRCRRCVGALAGPRSVGAADGTSALQVTSSRTRWRPVARRPSCGSWRTTNALNGLAGD